MTLIFTLNAPDYALQVTDRLVATGGLMFDPQSRKTVTVPPVPYDPIANKNALYCARDAMVAIAYTGVAYLDGVPTDRWIVEKLTGRSSLTGATSFVQFSKKPHHWLDLGQALQKLQVDLSALFARLHRNRRDIPFAVLLTGWQWNKCGRVRPVMASVSKDAGERAFRIYCLPRYWHFDDTERAKRQFSTRSEPIPAGKPIRLLAAPSGNISQAELVTLNIDDQRPNEAEQTLVRATRQIAARNGYVGPNCISILISPPSIGCVRVRYLAESNDTGRIGNRLTPVGFSPWLVGPCAITAPSALIGRWTTYLGPYAVTLDGPFDSSSTVLMLNDHSRMPPR